MNSRNHQLIKVCKVDSVSFASFAIKQDVDFLGIHVLTEADIGKHKELVKFVEEQGGKVVIVTKINAYEYLETVINLYAPYGIQLHFEIDTALAQRLQFNFPTLKLFGVYTDSTVYNDFEKMESHYNYLIYDTSYQGGTGSRNEYLSYSKFPDNLKRRTLLAGGVDSVRLKDLLPLEAGGFDIQNYFRTSYGLNFRNLVKITDELRLPRQGKLSVSLTDLPLIKIDQAASYYYQPHLDYHLDESDGILYPEFNTTSKSITEKRKFLNQLPFSMHYFIRSQEKLLRVIDEDSKNFPLNLTRIFVQYFDGLDEKLFFSDQFSIKIIPSVFFKDLQLFISKGIKTSFLSIVVPKPQHTESIDEFIRTFRENMSHFEGSELWLDRNLELGYIKLLESSLGINFNYIIGKEVINDWGKIKQLHEYISKQKSN